MTTKKIKLLPAQKEFFNDTETRHLLFLGGYGSGKTFALLNKLIQTALTNRGTDIGLVAPSLTMQNRIHVKDLNQLLTKYNITYTHKKQEKRFIIGNTNVYLYSAEDPDSIAGLNASSFFIDEMDLLRTEKAWDLMREVQGRVRVVAPINQICVSSTPNGFGFLYEFFEQNAAPDRKIIRGKTSENIHISSEYLQSLLANYTPEQIEAYCNGQFVNMQSGSVYRDYQIVEHDGALINAPLYIGVDFNIQHTSAIVFQEVVKGELLALDEIVDCYDTDALVEVCKTRYPGRRIVWYPDSAGAQRKTSAGGRTDHKILLEFENSSISVGTVNPLIVDRVNTCNWNFRKGTVKISSRCKTLIDALRRQCWDKNQMPDKSSGVDHILDGMGYAVHRILPMQMPHYKAPVVSPIPTKLGGTPRNHY